MVECQLPKLDVVGSSPISRSKILKSLPSDLPYDGTTLTPQKLILAEPAGAMLVTSPWPSDPRWLTFRKADRDFPLKSFIAVSARAFSSLV